MKDVSSRRSTENLVFGKSNQRNRWGGWGGAAGQHFGTLEWVCVIRRLMSKMTCFFFFFSCVTLYVFIVNANKSPCAAGNFNGRFRPGCVFNGSVFDISGAASSGAELHSGLLFRSANSIRIPGNVEHCLLMPHLSATFYREADARHKITTTSHYCLWAVESGRKLATTLCCLENKREVSREHLGNWYILRLQVFNIKG